MHGNFIDMSAHYYGRYQHMTLNRADGLWYADTDYRFAGLPAPRQDTPELTKKALERWAASDDVPPRAWAEEVFRARDDRAARIISTKPSVWSASRPVKRGWQGWPWF